MQSGELDGALLHHYPNALDVILYALRIAFSGALGVVGAIIVLGGLRYFDLPTGSVTTKLKLFLVVVTFLIGMHQDEFFAFPAQLNRGVLDKLKIDRPKNKT